MACIYTFEKIDRCPWCQSSSRDNLWKDQFGHVVCRCKDCGTVYASERLDAKSREVYWNGYNSKVHQSDKVLVDQRKQMYEIEYRFISDFIKDNCRVLDVGCGKGDFLQLFKEHGHKAFGVEIGKEAYDEALKSGIDVYFGEFPDIEELEFYDLVIFRGSIQYFTDPKKYFEKCVEILDLEGLVYIYYANTAAFCFELFKDKFTVPVSGFDYYGTNECILADYFGHKGFVKIATKDYYEDTPYANYESDILRVRRL